MSASHFVVTVAHRSSVDFESFPELDHRFGAFWECKTETEQEGHAAALRAVVAKTGADDGKVYAAFVRRESESPSEARKFWVSSDYLRTYDTWEYPETVARAESAPEVVQVSRALRISQLEAELLKCKAELHRLQSDPAQQGERELDAALGQQLAGHSEPLGLPFTHSGVSVPEPGVMRFSDVVLTRSIGHFGPGERFRAAIATQTTIRFLELIRPYEWCCSYRAQVAMVLGDLVLQLSEQAARGQA